MKTELILKQLDEIISQYEALKQRSQFADLSDLPDDLVQTIITRSIAAAKRIAGESSAYSSELARIFEQYRYSHQHVNHVIGVIRGLKADVDGGYLSNLIEIAHGDIFSEYLDMATHLLDAGYKDAAAVIAGSTLEGHLRALCKKNGISAEETKSDGKIGPMKSERLNSELSKAKIYEVLDNKNVTAWLDVRNKAAHGHYSEYTAAQVQIFISSLRDFLTRKPA